jgi:hypothetical protein
MSVSREKPALAAPTTAALRTKQRISRPRKTAIQMFRVITTASVMHLAKIHLPVETVPDFVETTSVIRANQTLAVVQAKIAHLPLLVARMVSVALARMRKTVRRTVPELPQN